MRQVQPFNRRRCLRQSVASPDAATNQDFTIPKNLKFVSCFGAWWFICFLLREYIMALNLKLKPYKAELLLTHCLQFSFKL